MLISEAKAYVGYQVHVRYTDRAGREHNERVEIFDVAFVALYGPCLITDIGEIRLDRVIACENVADAHAA
jgi:hypothetical protein